MDRLAITAEGPSSELGPFQGLRHEAGHTYPAPHEPKVFMREDEARNYLAGAWAEAIAAMPPVEPVRSGLTVDEWLNALGDRAQKPFLMTDQTELNELRAQLETARKAFRNLKSYAEHNSDCNPVDSGPCDCGLNQLIAQIGAEQTGPICLACIKAGEHHAKWCAGQKGGK